MIPNRIDNSFVPRFAKSAGVRKTRSFSLDPDLLLAIQRTKGKVSTSERVNQLLEYALDMETKAKLYKETAEFFADAPPGREERRAFQRANLRSWKRE